MQQKNSEVHSFGFHSFAAPPINWKKKFVNSYTNFNSNW